MRSCLHGVLGPGEFVGKRLVGVPVVSQPAQGSLLYAGPLPDARLTIVETAAS